MKVMILMAYAAAALSVSTSFAGQSPKFNTNHKMKAQEVFKKCGEWAKKETEKMKESTPAEKRAKSDAAIKAGESCSMNNGFDARGK